MREFIPIARPVIGDDEIAAAADVLRSGMLAQGEASLGSSRRSSQSIWV